MKTAQTASTGAEGDVEPLQATFPVPHNSTRFGHHPAPQFRRFRRNICRNISRLNGGGTVDTACNIRGKHR